MPRILATSSVTALDAVVSAAVGNGGNPPLVFTHTVGTGNNRLLVVSISCQDSNHLNLPVTSVTFQNVALNKAYSAPQGAGNVHSEIWYLMGPPSGAGSIVITTVGNVWVGAVSSSWTGIFQQTTTTTVPGSGIPSTAVISFDMMKWQKDCMINQVNSNGATNLLNVVKANFPGVTHIALSTLLNPTSDWTAAGGPQPSPLSSEALTSMWATAIHNAGYNIIWRGADGTMEGNTVGSVGIDYNFVIVSQPPSYWVNKAITFLNTHVNDIKNGDVIALYPEADGHINFGGGSNPIDNGSHQYTPDYNQFWQSLYTSIVSWATTNNKTVAVHTTVNGTSINNSAPSNAGGTGNPVVVDGVTILNGGSSFYSPSTLAITKMMTADWYNWQETSIGQPPPDETTYIQWYNASIDYWYFNLYAQAYQLFIQEWGDTRGTTSGSVQSSDPNLTGNMFDQVFFPRLRSGQMYGINAWDFFDTPQEGIISAQGDNVGYVNGGGSVTLNAKGSYLATIFNKWLGPGSGTTTTTTTGPDATTSLDSQSTSPQVTVNTVAPTTLIVDALSSESAITTSSQTILATAQRQAYENIAASYKFVTHSGNSTMTENTSGDSVFSLTGVSFQTAPLSAGRSPVTRSTGGTRSVAGTRKVVS